jgi:hypothetical protein
VNAPRRAGRSTLWWLAVIASGTGALVIMLAMGVMLIALAMFSGEPLQAPEVDAIDLGRLGADGPGTDFAAAPASREIRLADGTRLDESEIAYALRRENQHEEWASFNWLYEGKPVTTIAPGIDHRHHFANSYLVGYVPYPDVAPWVPLYALSQRKHYRFDHEQYPGMPEIWQTSREAFFFEEGDCEDHAIALADWLIGLGHDARVVLGQVDQGGHAWVVLIEDGNTYLLEATDKRQRPEQTLPLAQSLPEYRPEAMFNREDYWVNTGNVRTTDYTGPQWQLRSSFRRGADGSAAEGDTARPEASRPGEKRLRRPVTPGRN